MASPGILSELYGFIGGWVLLFWAMIKFFLPAKKKSLAGDIVLVTGAGSGIGRLLAINFAQRAATLVLWDIDDNGNKKTAELIRELGATAHCYVCDVSKKENVYQVAEQVKKDVGDVTVLVNNAGVVAGKKLLDCPDALVERTMNVNAMAHFWTIKAFLPSMIANNHGHLVTIASMAGSMGAAGLVEYCASKFAAVGLHESMMLELASMNASGVQTTLVQPSFIDTGLFEGFDQGNVPALQPQYVADKVTEAVETNQKILCLPRVAYIFTFIKLILPVDAYLHMLKYSGAFGMMDNFVGRQKRD
ncbi:epidermal retinol dehydrogenase 2-like [Glandiceps talaboti]